MKELAKYKTRAEADKVARVLDDAKIPIFILSDAPDGGGSANPGAKIMVNDGDFEKAQTLIK